LARKRDELTVVGRAAQYQKDGVEIEHIAERMNVKAGTVRGYISKARYRGLVNTPKVEDEMVRGTTKEVMEDNSLKDKELREIHERILTAPPGTNVVYFEHPAGWSKVPQNLRELITSMASKGLIVQLLKRNDRGAFSMIAQRTKR